MTGTGCSARRIATGLWFPKPWGRAQDGTLPPLQHDTAPVNGAHKKGDHALYATRDTGALTRGPRDGRVFARRDVRQARRSTCPLPWANTSGRSCGNTSSRPLKPGNTAASTRSISRPADTLKKIEAMHRADRMSLDLLLLDNMNLAPYVEKTAGPRSHDVPGPDRLLKSPPHSSNP